MSPQLEEDIKTLQTTLKSVPTTEKELVRVDTNTKLETLKNIIDLVQRVKQATYSTTHRALAMSFELGESKKRKSNPLNENYLRVLRALVRESARRYK